MHYTEVRGEKYVEYDERCFRSFRSNRTRQKKSRAYFFCLFFMFFYKKIRKKNPAYGRHSTAYFKLKERQAEKWRDQVSREKPLVASTCFSPFSCSLVAKKQNLCWQGIVYSEQSEAALHG